MLTNIRSSNFEKLPKRFQSSHVYWVEPGATDSEEVLDDDGAVLLVGGDDKGQDTAVHQELPADGFFLRDYIIGSRTGLSAINFLGNNISHLCVLVLKDSFFIWILFQNKCPHLNVYIHINYNYTVQEDRWV